MADKISANVGNFSKATYFGYDNIKLTKVIAEIWEHGNVAKMQPGLNSQRGILGILILVLYSQY